MSFVFVFEGIRILLNVNNRVLMPIVRHLKRTINVWKPTTMSIVCSIESRYSGFNCSWTAKTAINFMFSAIYAMALYSPAQVEPNGNMIPNNTQRTAATVASPLPKWAEIAIFLAGTVWPQVEYFGQYIVFTLFWLQLHFNCSRWCLKEC